MDHANPQAAHEAIKQALFAGQKIFAIKLYRELHHVGLAEAKAAVEKLETELGIPAVRNANQTRVAACFVMLLLIAGLGVLIWRALALWHGHASP